MHINTFLQVRGMSFGKLEMSVEVATHMVRMTRTREQLLGDETIGSDGRPFSLYFDEAERLYQTADPVWNPAINAQGTGKFTFSNFDIVYVVAPQDYQRFVGIALLESGKAYCNGCARRGILKQFEVMLHELMHTIGWQHANGPLLYDDYGDPFEVMGNFYTPGEQYLCILCNVLFVIDRFRLLCSPKTCCVARTFSPCYTVHTYLYL